jgi:rRNA methylases|tara:strand:+ start:1403 stop:2152 length:750 start_codon:yes stop_codon:yes gene_type:complete
MKKKMADYWMYSKHSIETALQNPERKVKEMLVEKSSESFYRAFLEKNNIFRKKIKFKVTKKTEIVKKIGKLAKYQGVALLVEKINLVASNFLKESLNNERFILIIDQLNDPSNLGSLLRVSHAFGVSSVIIPERYITEENGYVASIASGSLDKIKIFKIKNLVNTINYLKNKSWWIIGLESKKFSNCINLKEKQHKFDKKALILGSENVGLRKLVRENCDVLYRIPTKRHDLDSLNVVQAASIALYELV